MAVRSRESCERLLPASLLSLRTRQTAKTSSAAAITVTTRPNDVRQRGATWRRSICVTTFASRLSSHLGTRPAPRLAKERFLLNLAVAFGRIGVADRDRTGDL